ncbi:hypothetical protein [Methylobacterium nodulans]|nr:hypothetical protein [Methylobacterium nodulans]
MVRLAITVLIFGFLTTVTTVAGESLGPSSAMSDAAIKLSGLVRFVAEDCPDDKPDYDRFRQVMMSLGIDLEALSSGAYVIKSMRYTEKYKENRQINCKLAHEKFGKEGNVIPGLLIPK